MITVDNFFEKIVIDDKIKEMLIDVWMDIDDYINKLSKYTIQSQNVFLQDYLIKENVASYNVENLLYSSDVMKLYNNKMFSYDKINEDFIKIINKYVRCNDRIIERDKYINTYNDLSYEEYLIREKKSLEGNYRDNIVWLGGNNIEESVHIPPKPEEIPDYMKEFVKLYNSNFKNNDLNDPIIKSSLIHLYFIKIHPFLNGNGRTARILLNHYLHTSINKKYNIDLLYPPFNLSLSFNMSKASYNKKQNDVIFKKDYDNNEAINSWIKYNILVIQEQLYFLNTRLDKYDSLLKREKGYNI